MGRWWRCRPTAARMTRPSRQCRRADEEDAPATSVGGVGAAAAAPLTQEALQRAVLDSGDLESQAGAFDQPPPGPSGAATLHTHKTGSAGSLFGGMSNGGSSSWFRGQAGAVVETGSALDDGASTNSFGLGPPEVVGG